MNPRRLQRETIFSIRSPVFGSAIGRAVFSRRILMSRYGQQTRSKQPGSKLRRIRKSQVPNPVADSGFWSLRFEASLGFGAGFMKLPLPAFVSFGITHWADLC